MCTHWRRGPLPVSALAEICASQKVNFCNKFFEFQPPQCHKQQIFYTTAFHMHLPDMYEYLRFIFSQRADINYLMYHTPALSLKGTSNSEF
jgi:hypothetical protein